MAVVPGLEGKIMDNEFNLLAWSGSIPLCDDLWLGMQVRNIAIVDLSIIRDIEAQALAAYMERERTPTDILLPLSALSQMWIFSVYEFLRTWRQRAQEILKVAEGYASRNASDRSAFLAKAIKDAEEKEKMIKYAPRYYAEHIGRVEDDSFVSEIKGYFRASEEVFRAAEAVRVTLAKHEVPKTRGIVAEAPGYGRMNYLNGAIYWTILLKDGSMMQVDRRELSSAFLGISEELD